MEESKETEVHAEDEKDSISAYKYFEESGKLKINEALYALVPDSMTMGEFENLTCDVFYKIREAWDKAFSSSGE